MPHPSLRTMRRHIAVSRTVVGSTRRCGRYQMNRKPKFTPEINPACIHPLKITGSSDLYLVCQPSEHDRTLRIREFGWLHHACSRWHIKATTHSTSTMSCRSIQLVQETDACLVAVATIHRHVRPRYYRRAARSFIKHVMGESPVYSVDMQCSHQLRSAHHGRLE